MILTRFCSRKEYNKFISGKTLVNRTDHFRGGRGGSTSVGFCFTSDPPRTAWRYLKGIVTHDVCMVVDIPDSLLILSLGKYVDYSKRNDGHLHTCLKTEYSLTQYSDKTAKLIKVLQPHEFATPEELQVLNLFGKIKRLFN